VRRWCAERGVDVGYIGPLGQVWRLARAWYGDRLEPGFRRRTPDEAQALFAELGLSGAFWQLAPA
jgi:hypothetical protein